MLKQILKTFYSIFFYHKFWRLNLIICYKCWFSLTASATSEPHSGLVNGTFQLNGSSTGRNAPNHLCLAKMLWLRINGTDSQEISLNDKWQGKHAKGFQKHGCGRSWASPIHQPRQCYSCQQLIDISSEFDSGLLNVLNWVFIGFAPILKL